MEQSTVGEQHEGDERAKDRLKAIGLRQLTEATSREEIDLREHIKELWRR